jgi:fructokinase
MKQDCLCIFGEVLFDHFPDGKRVLGGAPFNVAWHLQAFGQAPCFISRVGTDPEGDAVKDAMQAWGMRIDNLQMDAHRPTGRVNVSFVNGEPEYDIAEQCAYDAIAVEPVGCDCRLLYHGSLALRESTSRQAVESIKSSLPDIVFIDVNLRTPWWQKTQVQDMLHEADWVKLNSDELDLLDTSNKQGTAKAKQFLDTHALKGLLVTHGSAGAELITANDEYFTIRPKENIAVVDTVGAGDAFAAVMILGLANNWPLDMTLERAQNFASGLVSNRGATVNDPAFYLAFIESWALEA